MSKKQMTLVYYYVPEDHDDPEYPNVFGVMVGKDNIRLNHIIQNFPLSGTYLFRFKAIYDNTTVWLDFNDSNRQVPLIKNKVYVKATRITWQSQNPINYLREGKQQMIQQQHKPSSLNKQTSSTKSEKNLVVGQLKAKGKTEKKTSQNLLDIKHQPKTNQPQNTDLINHNINPSDSHDLLQSHNYNQNQSNNSSSTQYPLLTTSGGNGNGNGNLNISTQLSFANLLHQPDNKNIANTNKKIDIFDHMDISTSSYIQIPKSNTNTATSGLIQLQHLNNNSANMNQSMNISGHHNQNHDYLL